MAHIKTEKQHTAIMDRIDQLFWETNENTPADDPRLVELDMLSALVEEYEKQKELSKVLDITAPRLSEILNGRKEPTYRQAQKIATTLQIDANIVLAIS